MTLDLAFVVAPLSRGGGEAEYSWTRNYPTQGLPVSTTSVCLRFSVFLQSRPTIDCVRPSIVLSIYIQGSVTFEYFCRVWKVLFPNNKRAKLGLHSPYILRHSNIHKGQPMAQ